MLTQIGKREHIETVVSLFALLLAKFQINGYNYNEGIITSPTKEFLEEIRKLNITGMDTLFTENFDTVMAKFQNDCLEKRLLLGLDIREEEYQKIKMELSQKKKKIR